MTRAPVHCSLSPTRPWRLAAGRPHLHVLPSLSSTSVKRPGAKDEAVPPPPNKQAEETWARCFPMLGAFPVSRLGHARNTEVLQPLECMQTGLIWQIICAKSVRAFTHTCFFPTKTSLLRTPKQGHFAKNLLPAKN